MSNRTLVELNHDYCPRDQDLLAWAKNMQCYMRSGNAGLLPDGVTFKHMRHHSEPDPLAPSRTGATTPPAECTNGASPPPSQDASGISRPPIPHPTTETTK